MREACGNHGVEDGGLASVEASASGMAGAVMAVAIVSTLGTGLFIYVVSALTGFYGNSWKLWTIALPFLFLWNLMVLAFVRGSHEIDQAAVVAQTDVDAVAKAEAWRAYSEMLERDYDYPEVPRINGTYES